jgi:hypothetical protein
VIFVSDFDGDAADIIQNTDSSTIPDGASHCFELDTETNDGKFGLLFPLENLVAAELFSAGDDRVCSIQFKYKATSGVQNIRAQVLSWTGTVDALQDPVSDWQDLTADIDLTYTASWTPENAGAQIQTDTAWQTYTLENIAIDTAGAVNVALLIYVSDIDLLAGTDKIYLADVHLNEGATVSQYLRPNKRDEYGQCQKFMMKSFLEGVMPATNTGDNDGCLTTIITNGTNDDDQSVRVVYPQPMFKDPAVVFYNPQSANAEWYGFTDVQDEGANLNLFPTANGFQAKADNAVGGGGDILIIHYTAIAEIVN